MRKAIWLLILIGGLGIGYAVWSRFMAGSQATPAKAESPQASAGGNRNARNGNGRTAGPTAVLAAIAERGDLPIVRTAVGWVEPIASVVVRPRIDGVIVEQHAVDGQMVKAGDVLFKLDDREINAQIAKDEAGLARDQAALAKAQAAAKRVQTLQARKLASPEEADQAVADLKVAAANVEASQAALGADRIQLDYTTIRTPIDGRVGAVRSTPGNLVRSADADGLVTVTQMQPLRVSFALPESDLELLRAALGGDQQAVVKAMAGASDKLLDEGILSFLDSQVDVTSGTIKAWAQMANDDSALWPGQYVRVAVALGRMRDVVTVPQVAVQPGQDSAYVFLVTAERKVTMRKVVVKMSYADRAAIASGLNPGDQVVVEGQQRLNDGSPVQVTLAAPSTPAVEIGSTADNKNTVQ